jgi:hypothetical protein
MLLLVSILMLLFMNGIQADVFLTAENLNSSLKQMRRLELKIDADSMGNADDLYELGVEAEVLAKLLTDEVTAHGPQNEGLITLALERTGSMGIIIEWFGRNESFYYDGAVFHAYLAQEPNGIHNADSRFRLMQRSFFLGGNVTVSGLLEAVAAKRAFITSYPDFHKLHEVELYLAIDLRDLWRLYIESGDTALAADYREKTRDQFIHTRDTYDQLEAGSIASRLLERFEGEIEKLTGQGISP